MAVVVMVVVVMVVQVVSTSVSQPALVERKMTLSACRLAVGWGNLCAAKRGLR